MNRLAAIALLGLLFAGTAAAQATDPRSDSAADLPPRVAQVLELLADPSVREWAERQRAQATPSVPADENTVSAALARRLAAIRSHVAGLVQRAPNAPGDIARAAADWKAELDEAPRVPLLAAAVLLAGIGGEILLRWLMRPATGRRERPATPTARLALLGADLGRELAGPFGFAIGSIAALLATDWPPLTRRILVGYLGAFLLLRFGAALLRVLLAPAAAGENTESGAFGVLPLSRPTARFWYRRLLLLLGWFVFGWVTVDLVTEFGLPTETRRLVAYVLGLGLLAISIESAWTVPRERARTAASERRRAALLSAYFLVLWVLWVMSAMGLFWLAVVALALPTAIGLAQRAIDNVYGTWPDPDAGLLPGITAVLLQRGVRALLIILATILLARAWHVDLIALTESDNGVTRLARGVLGAVVVVLLADLVWQMIRHAIDRAIAETGGHGLAETEEARRRARLRTLLPLLRNVLLATVLTIAAMMILSAWGVAVGPLIAGAGVIGVALAFGAQTLVRDMISGMFYLLDDAFRVGEYIQSGTYKGTVESFSLRSVKLRHHRGPLYTVPFGVLGAVQNMSRDWVIEKLTVSVPYNTQIDEVKKIVKEVGKTLADDPAFKPNLLETLKMQGIEQFGEFAIQIRMKMMTRPGEQFVIRRRAYALIKKAFEAHGISFAFPTVKVAGNGEAAGAVATQTLNLIRKDPTAA